MSIRQKKNIALAFIGGDDIITVGKKIFKCGTERPARSIIFLHCDISSDIVIL